MNTTEELPPVAKKLVQHLGERNYQLKSERYCRQRAETTALSMISGDVFESVEMYLNMQVRSSYGDVVTN